MTSANIILSTTAAELQKQWCVYELYNGKTAAVEYIGCCKLSNLFSIPDARSNVLFDDTFKECETIMIRLLKQFESKAEAKKAVIEKINQGGTPSMNCVSLNGVQYFVKCVSTDEVFRNAKAACQAHGLCEAHLSNHLNRKEGYNLCQGKSYKKVKP